MEIRFDGQIVAITGGGSGFGRAMVRAFAGMGARVFTCDLSQDGLDEACAGLPVAAERVDLADRSAAAEWVRNVERQAGAAVQVLVSNAGGSLGIRHTPIEDLPDDDWDRLFATNLHGTFSVCRAAARGMKAAGRGRIVTISSGAGLRPSLTRVQAYTSAKHAVVGLTKQLAHEFGPHGITVNSVAPGLVTTTPWRVRQWESYGPEGQREKLERTAMRRLGTPEDICNAVVFFASDLAGFVTGQILSVDGGQF